MVIVESDVSRRDGPDIVEFKKIVNKAKIVFVVEEDLSFFDATIVDMVDFVVCERRI